MSIWLKNVFCVVLKISFRARVQINRSRIAIRNPIWWFYRFFFFFLVFMKFVNQFSITNHSFKIFTEYCFRKNIAKTLCFLKCLFTWSSMIHCLRLFHVQSLINNNLIKNTLVVLVSPVRAACSADLLFHAMMPYTSIPVWDFMGWCTSVTKVD